MVTASPEVTNLLFKRIGYDPTQGGRNKFQPEILACDATFILVAGGEQAGKSVCASKHFLKKWPEDMARHEGFGDGLGPPLLYWLVAADYGETLKEFTYIIDDLLALGLPVKSSKVVNPGWIQLQFPNEMKPRLRIETKSGKDISKLSKDSPHGIIICEASQCDVLVFERCRGRVTPRDGWLFLSGTFEREFGETMGWFRQQFTAWQAGLNDRKSFSLPSPSNVAIYEDGWDTERLKQLKEESSDEFFMERIEGKPVPATGMVFTFIPDLHIRDISFNPDLDVSIANDPGYAGANATLAIQMVNDVVYVFDEVYERKITEDCIDIIRMKPWAQRITEGFIDHAGTQHQAQSPATDLWLADPHPDGNGGGLGLYMRSIPIPDVNPMDERLKGFLKPHPSTGQSSVVIAPHCHGILSEMGVMANPLDGKFSAYRWGRDRQGNIVGRVPANENNHSIRALEYFLINKFGYAYADPAGRELRMKRW